MVNDTYVFVDVETTGVNAARGRVIELAAIRVENDIVVKTLTTLVNPEMPISYQITQITGISDADVAGKPTFQEIADELSDILDGAVFVAHNVRFDYSFLRHEFRRVGKKFLPKQLCTVKLSRSLYPEMARHRLSDVIAHHGFSFESRHRAYDDANVLVQFWKKIREDHPEQVIDDAIAKQMRRPSIPTYINHKDIDALPQAPGVYVFHDDAGDPIYIGKSIDIKTRVLSHFLRDVDEQKEFKISQLIRSISYTRTTGELSALLLESAMIKEKMPLYNRRLRRLKKLTITTRLVDASGYTVLALEELSMNELPDRSQIVAMHPRRSAARDSLERHIKTFELCPKLCGVEWGKGPCFAYQLGKCRGACIGEELPSSYNARVDIAYQGRGVDEWPYDGAVLIVERDDESGEQTGFVVDNWIIRAKLHYLPDMDVVVEPYQELFDLDAYTILRNYLLTRGERVTISPYNEELS